MADAKERRFQEIMGMLVSINERLLRIEETLQADWLRLVNAADYEDWLVERENDQNDLPSNPV